MLNLLAADVGLLSCIWHDAAGIRLPGPIAYDGTQFSDIPSGFAALSAIPGAGLTQIIAFIGILELAVMKDITGGDFVGDFRNGAVDFGWDTFDEETKLKKRAIELNNGYENASAALSTACFSTILLLFLIRRAAQMGILALVRCSLMVSIVGYKFRQLTNPFADGPRRTWCVTSSLTSSLSYSRQEHHDCYMTPSYNEIRFWVLHSNCIFVFSFHVCYTLS